MFAWSYNVYKSRERPEPPPPPPAAAARAGARGVPGPTRDGAKNVPTLPRGKTGAARGGGRVARRGAAAACAVVHTPQVRGRSAQARRGDGRMERKLSPPVARAGRVKSSQTQSSSFPPLVASHARIAISASCSARSRARMAESASCSARCNAASKALIRAG